MAGLVQCTFSLNDQPMSGLVCNGRVYAAFSGLLGGRDNPAMAAVPDRGPIPPGVYYIVDHPKGGRLQWLNDEVRDAISDSHRATWFALYSTTTANDFMFVNGVKWGNFRLHPIGRLG
jgi:hypothetical protein